ncbi:N-acetyltransferase [Virgibacillus byunsanensis]|uniref:N-acetyltransferase n=1 Tax=Virgibacillus byunsanensis TaxID=570945 RepID=A0ABW3LGP7_9BACI
MENYIKETPWDRRNFNINTYELTSTTDEALKSSDKHPGHYTLKVDPLESPKKLLRHGFYYVDTLIEPVCTKEKLNLFSNEDTLISKEYNSKDINEIAEEVFTHGRFHRDFNIPSSMADLRYRNWVKDLQANDQICALYYKGGLAGFYAYENDKVLLLGIKKEYQNKGLAKAFTSQGCYTQLKLGHDQLRTSISAANVTSLNLFYALGFRLSHTIDVYHKLNRTALNGV